jgi:hypothetical protein
MRYLAALTVSAVTVLMIAACGSSTSSPSFPGSPWQDAETRTSGGGSGG